MYQFRVVGGEPDADPAAAEYPDIDAARNAAVMFAGEMIRDNPALLREPGKFRVDVLDETGRIASSVLLTYREDPPRVVH